MSPLTIYLGRLLGVACLIMCVALALRRKAAVAAIDDLTERPGPLLVTGAFTVLAGAALVVGHQRWSGGVLPIVVTVLGWLTLLKGTAVLLLSPAALRRVYAALGYPRTFPWMMGVFALGAAALTIAAFRA